MSVMIAAASAETCDMLPPAVARPKRSFFGLLDVATSYPQMRKSMRRINDAFPNLSNNLTIIETSKNSFCDIDLWMALKETAAKHRYYEKHGEDDLPHMDDDKATKTDNLVCRDTHADATHTGGEARANLDDDGDDKVQTKQDALFDNLVTPTAFVPKHGTFSYLAKYIRDDITLDNLMALSLPTDDALDAWLEGLERPATRYDVSNLLLDAFMSHKLVDKLALAIYNALGHKMAARIGLSCTSMNPRTWRWQNTIVGKIYRDILLVDAFFVFCAVSDELLDPYIQKTMQHAAAYNARRKLLAMPVAAQTLHHTNKGRVSLCRFLWTLYGPAQARCIYDSIMPEYPLPPYYTVSEEEFDVSHANALLNKASGAV